ncbi:MULTISPECIES: spore cortex biosynthesis protein YabQ [Bacillaceae]|uniref:Spore cortex biosynthesis protein YabQ n=2 Tax=Bacillaceae TaxID=186817 RepID=A0A9D5I0G8_9BACI|nr:MULTISPECIES: spore cortex biosynthesis protein YabQ [Bacillaceae]KQL51644.1 hypothetical protein AN965_19685 [Alkalicoccobacillus plakortidis]MBG9782376.1 hypothetical protein [Shouchella lehensis]RQW18108.1 spore cortex biosynthesis protein YabQ [Bacillus sp. C1-1]TES46886.1 spore cortex biosynthesis protein YabQ [Shouchella lehensis]
MTLTVQFLSMLSMAAMGVWLGAALDTYHRFIGKKHSFDIQTAVADFCFWTVQALLVFYILYQVNFGEVRIFVFIALMLGFAAYQAMFKRLYNKVLTGIIFFFKKLFAFLVIVIKTLLFNPVKWLLHICRRFAMMIVLTLWSLIFYLLWKPLYFVLSLLGVVKVAKKGQPIFEKIKGFCDRLMKKK